MGALDAGGPGMKEQTTVQVEEKETGSGSSSDSTSATSDWEPGKLKRCKYFELHALFVATQMKPHVLTTLLVPVGGAAALFFVLCCSTTALLVLFIIHGRLASSWPRIFQPNVCLSVLNGLSTLSIAYAVANGIAIAWWRRAMLGASIKELHYTWSFSASFTSILLKIKYFNVIALAALAAKVAIIDGVLYQRALSTAVIQDTTGENRTLRSFFMDHFPYTGIMPRDNQSFGSMDSAFASNVWLWSQAGDGTVYRGSSSVDGCDAAICTFNVSGAGLGAECTQKLINNTYLSDAKAGRSVTGNLTVFSVDMKMLYPDSTKNYSRIQLSALWPTDTIDPDQRYVSVVPTEFRSVICELRPALVRYNMLFTNSSSFARGEKPLPISSYMSDPLSKGSGCQVGSDPFVITGYAGSMCMQNATICRNQVDDIKATFSPKYDVYEPYKPGANSSLFGIYQILADHYVSSAVTTYYDNAFHTAEHGEFASLSSWTDYSTSSQGNFSYSDPINNIMQRINTLTMIVASDPFSYSEGLTENYTVRFNQEKVPCLKYWKDKEYVIAYAWLWSAFGLTFVVIFLILPVYWGYWQLGRNVTLGPMEIAYAFQGPAFAAAQTQSGHADHIVRAVGRQKIQYGVDDPTSKRLVFKSTSPV